VLMRNGLLVIGLESPRIRCAGVPKTFMDYSARCLELPASARMHDSPALPIRARGVWKHAVLIRVSESLADIAVSVLWDSLLRQSGSSPVAASAP